MPQISKEQIEQALKITKQLTNGSGMTNDEMIAAAVNAYLGELK